ncbi:hypothetical protein N7486_007160 [Penicillium sp. IBT 16267x]|nr:hypothetical protein N7486_007160 [Penicillium sp. IBT 16267x]
MQTLRARCATRIMAWRRSSQLVAPREDLLKGINRFWDALARMGSTMYFSSILFAMAPLGRPVPPHDDPLKGIDKLWDALARMGGNTVGNARLELVGILLLAALGLGLVHLLLAALTNEYYR